ncbi:SUMF1/EgtB/PvdO family nonheme iron enzyme [Ideonella sp.]|jgi:formylglycine-generating enzyme required for sulfatase activity|uniref:SUMF1/EgtB/PvdO family nonheme iron enzyme n=1 Tax=Ideonella sp. TaxID=1929293 RepID=UPI0037BE29BD
MSKTPIAAPVSSESPVSPEGPEDWLGYGLYADSLWARVRLALSTAKVQSAHALPTADPLVVGVYGEWGAGKSRLLELVYDRARRQNGKDVAQRLQDPSAYAGSPLLNVTVPVWFHPWRYEHEPHLAVPLLMHVSEALQTTLKDMGTWRESAQRALATLTPEVKAEFEKKWGLVESTAKVTAKVAGHGITKAVVGVAAGFFGAGELAKGALEHVEGTAKLLAGEDTGDTKAKDEPKNQQDKSPAYTADGRHYYQVQKFLRDLSRITPEEAKAQGVELTQAVELRFVVFIDDLDRCLPEKAVAMLEVIKTVFNVESFAFVVALDDEVIERGISHRYRDYRFKGAKPEMPITGFEYLEKIVHLPFRLPALTREQAETFVRQHEDRLMADPALPPGCQRLWFTQTMERGLGDEGAPGKQASAAATATARPTPLTQMLLDSFEAYVPRKLLRAQELMHQWQCVLAARGKAMQGAPDQAMLLALALLQLFAPDLYRLVRRRPGLWKEWMNAYQPMLEGFEPVLSRQRRETPPHFELNASDATLYRWAAMGPRAGWARKDDEDKGFVLERTALGGDITVWRAAVAHGLAKEPGTLHSAEQVRLPFVLTLCEYRNAHRHAYSPLLMGAALAHTLNWESAADIGEPSRYWSLLPGDALRASLEPPRAGGVEISYRQRIDISLLSLKEILSSSDASTRSTLVERLGLVSGHVLPPTLLEEVRRIITPLSTTQQLAVWAQLAPFMEAALLPEKLNNEYSDKVLDDTELPLLAPHLRVLGEHGLLEPLGLTRQVDTVRQQLGQRRDDLERPVKEREQAANTVAALGDDRFAFDPRRWQLPSKRARIWDGEAWREATPSEEPILGFVRVEKAPFVRGERGEEDNPPCPIELPTFYMARTLTTVAQWQCFIDADGYENPEWWDAPQAWAWRLGEFDSQVEDLGYQDWLAQRSKDQRHQPQRWAEQMAHPQRPVWGVSWFEARAYARWLTTQIQVEIGAAGLAGWQARLPTEDQTERAMRSISLTQADRRRYVWGENESHAAQFANCGATGLGHLTQVGLFASNPLGLFDLAGNLWTWQDNLYQPKAIQGLWPRVSHGQPIKTDRDLEKCDRMALRGGSWFEKPHFLRCAYRIRRIPDFSDVNVGVRVTLSQVT